MSGRASLCRYHNTSTSSRHCVGLLVCSLVHWLHSLWFSKSTSWIFMKFGADIQYHKKAVLSQRWLRNAPYTRSFSGLTDYAKGYYSIQCLLGLHRIWLFQIRPKPNLAETCFLVTEQYASDKTNGVNNAVSHYRGSTLQCFLCCITVCQLLIKFVE